MNATLDANDATAPKRPQQLSLLQTEPVEIYVQAGRLGRHATTRGWPSAWAAHPTDDATAVYRCALKYYWGGRDNGLFLYSHFQSVTIAEQPKAEKREGATVWRASVVQDKSTDGLKRVGHRAPKKSAKKGRKK